MPFFFQKDQKNYLYLLRSAQTMWCGGQRATRGQLQLLFILCETKSLSSSKAVSAP